MNKAALLVVLALGAMLPGLAAGTAQVPDRIIIEGESHYLQTNPLSAVLQEREWKPPEGTVSSSANWRGYVATWAIDRGELVLEDVTTDLHGGTSGQYEKASQKDALFPGQDRVVATWYSGALVIPEGEVVEYQHMGYGSVYERYQVLRISDGQVTSHLRMSGEEFARFKESQWEAYRKTAHYRKVYDELRADREDWSEELTEEFLRGYYSELYLNR